MLTFGWSSKNIGVDGPVGITGQFYERVSKGKLDENTVTALVIDDGHNVSVMMSGDLIGVDDGLIFDLREAVRAKNPAIPAEKILFSATHAHTTPRYMKMGHTGYDKAPHDRIEYMPPEEYRSLLVDRASDAVVEAYESRREGSYAYGYGYAVVAHHRRPTYADDLRQRPNNPYPPSLAVNKHAWMYGKTNDPMFLGYEGNVDSTVYFMFTFDQNEKLTGAVINVPCPSQNSEFESYLTADYWAQLRALIREKYGDVFILPQCACAGDMSPRTLHARAAEERKYALKYENTTFEELLRPREMLNRMEIAQRIMEAFDDTYRWAQKDKIRSAKLLHTVKNVPLEAWKISREQYESAKKEYAFYQKQEFVTTDDEYQDFEKNTRHSSVLSRYEDIIRRYEQGPELYHPEIHVVALGDVAFVSNPFELYINYQHRIQARSPFVQTFAIQLAAATDCSGYLCTAPAAENMGYSANIYSCQVSPKGGDTLVEETVAELNRLHAQ